MVCHDNPKRHIFQTVQEKKYLSLYNRSQLIALHTDRRIWKSRKKTHPNIVDIV